MPFPLPHSDSGSAISVLSAPSASNLSPAVSFRTLDCELSTVDCQLPLTPIIPAHTRPPGWGGYTGSLVQPRRARRPPRLCHPDRNGRLFLPFALRERRPRSGGTAATNPCPTLTDGAPEILNGGSANGPFTTSTPRQRLRCSLHRRYEFSGTPSPATQTETRRRLHEEIRCYAAGLFRAAWSAQVGNPPRKANQKLAA